MPIVFMSARDQEFDRIIGLEKGCDEYITKPFNIKELILRIHNVLKRVYKDDPALINVDGYAVDEEKRKVCVPNATGSRNGCRGKSGEAGYFK